MGNEKMVKVENKSPLDSRGWKKAIDREELDKYCVQDIVRAARSINISGDRSILVALMSYISDQMIRVLSATIGTNQPNRSDMIHDVQHEMICAVLDPDSKDGAGLCEAFVPRMRVFALLMRSRKKQLAVIATRTQALCLIQHLRTSHDACLTKITKIFTSNRFLI